MDPGGDACANAEFLLQILDEITESILMSAEACPKYVTAIIFPRYNRQEIKYLFLL